MGARASVNGIRDLIRALGELPPGHPFENLLNQAPELRNEAAIADALLHPQDRAYSVSQFFALIERAGLTFIRWLRQAPYSVNCGVLAKIPQAEEIVQLPLQEQYTLSELFRGTMIRHSAVVYRKDCTRSLRPVTFAGDQWLDYVPVCMTDTLCIQDRVPTGAAAVLLNRTHTYRDLYLAINNTEKKLFDAIDGRLAIADIVESTLPSKDRGAYLNAARTFFEQLWWHDQVVFDIHQNEREPFPEHGNST
jgi:hypothetical protein